ncbi:glutamate decarboxylase [Streptomyces spectabilis]|uniref:Glutamate decarboxylase n=1 Tax=Streptomyces spectabilis TaxID=68270 RepID=A0A516R1M0_STRST|nr:glutamate decarboxylase [Streptomyces spectabilis]QDQ09554.1 glutamate decarboxylase [Streptomyces spectabilis]
MSNLVRRVPESQRNELLSVNPLYAGLMPADGVPTYQLAENPISPDAAQAIIRDELMLDGNSRLNLATFCSTWMEPQARELIAETLDRNLLDHDQYPQTAELEGRCVNILDNLWRDPDGKSIGCSTAGSSEAAMLAGLALKFRWRDRQKAAGRPFDRPNLVMGSTVHTCWPKFGRYWDVEIRQVPIEQGSLTLNPQGVVEHCDENTIGVIAVLGSTQLGYYDPVAEISAALDQFQESSGLDIPIHVDAAVGGFIAPFLEPDLVWDFRLPRVQSINASGHKFGLVYPGVGWVVWQEPDDLPKDLVFECNLLGGSINTFTLNFSRPGAPVVAQYYNFLRLGFAGYRAVQQTSRDVAQYIAGEVATIPSLELLADGSELPLIAFKTRDGCDDFTVFELSDRLRTRGWQLPAYYLPPDLEHVGVLRMVIRNGFSRATAALLITDLRREVEGLTSGGSARDPKTAPGDCTPAQ